MKMIQAQSSTEANKRSYVRVNDIAVLHYKVISVDDYDNIKAQSEQLGADKLMLKARFECITRELRPLQRAIGTSNPQIAQYFSSIDKKLDILSESLLDDKTIDLDATIPQAVNVSAGGLSFTSPSAIESGSILELKMMLLSTNTGISSYADVIYCTRIGDMVEKTNSYNIIVKFKDMNDEVRDLVSRHVLSREWKSFSVKK